MANNTTIQLKRTATAGGVPTNLLANAELGYNLTDKRLFTTATTGGAVFDAVQNTASDFAITGASVQLFVGNSTVNSTSNSSVHKLQNSTVSSIISIANVVTTNVYASFYSTGNIASASQLGSGVANSTTFLAGDLTFKTVTGGSGTPGGANTQVQFNDSTAFAGSAGFTFNKNSNVVSISNNLVVATKLNVGSAAGFDFGTSALVEIDGAQNTYVQFVIQNANSGTQASSDLVVTADTGNDSVNYLDLGINSSTYSNAAFNLTGPLDTYLYSSNSHLVIGTASDKEVIFHANGTTTTDRKFTINTVSVTVNNIPLVVGNSTINATLSTTSLVVANSTKSTTINQANIITSNVYAAFLASGNIVAASQLGGGTANSTTFLRGDLTFAAPTATAAPAGANTQVQYNDSGSTGADAAFTWNKTTDTLTVGNSTVGTIIVGTGTSNIVKTNTSILIQTNTTVNTVITASSTTIANSTTNTVISPSLLTIGNSTSYGSFSNTTMLIASNSTVNSIITDATITVQNSTSIGLLSPLQVNLGNSTVNAFVNTTTLVIQSNSTANVTLKNSSLQMFLGNTTGGDVTAPTGNSFTIFGKYRAGRIMASSIESSGFGGVPFQSHFMHTQMAALLPIPNSTSVTTIRCTSANTVAFSGRAPTSGNTFLSSYRNSQTTGATAGTSISWRINNIQWWKGNAAGLGGFYAVARFGVAITTTNGRAFIGFKDSITILANGAPSAQTNIIGFSWDASNSTINTMRAISANSTAATQIDLGSGFPINTGNTDWYEASIYAVPNGGAINYQVTNLKNGNTVFGTYGATNVPSNTTFMTWHFWGNNGSDAAALVMDWGGVTIETLY